MLCAIAFKPIERKESFSNLYICELILEIVEKMHHCKER
jgi:hypothetical protein